MVKNSPKLARLGRGVHRVLYTLQKSIPLSYCVPQTLGGTSDNIWNKFIYIYTPLLPGKEKPWQLQQNRKPLWDYIKTHQCKNILEIGFGTGENAEGMIELVGENCNYYCFDNLRLYMSRKLFKKLKDIKNVHFYIGDTKETLPKAINGLPKMDMIFIDGGHDYDTCKSDWENCRRLMHSKTAVFFHDYFGGPENEVRPDVKRVVDEIDDRFSVKIIKSKYGPWLALVRRKSNG